MNMQFPVFSSWTRNSENWLRRNETEEPILCGNVTGSRHCPLTHTCLCVGENPNHGYTSFDNFLWSMLTTFQLITLDYWENVYNMVGVPLPVAIRAVSSTWFFWLQVLASCGPISVSFFTVVVFFGSFYLINLMLAVVALAYEEEAEITQEVSTCFENLFLHTGSLERPVNFFISFFFFGRVFVCPSHLPSSFPNQLLIDFLVSCSYVLNTKLTKFRKPARLTNFFSILFKKYRNLHAFQAKPVHWGLDFVPNIQDGFPI